jgi:hypothetical protein
VELPSGTYVVVVPSGKTELKRLAKNGDVKGVEYLQLDIDIDTGIR